MSTTSLKYTLPTIDVERDLFAAGGRPYVTGGLFAARKPAPSLSRGPLLRLGIAFYLILSKKYDKILSLYRNSGAG